MRKIEKLEIKKVTPRKLMDAKVLGRPHVRPHGNRQVTPGIATSNKRECYERGNGHEEERDEKRREKGPGEDAQPESTWVDPMCGPIRP